jgi:hypothetical protein
LFARLGQEALDEKQRKFTEMQSRQLRGFDPALVEHESGPRNQIRSENAFEELLYKLVHPSSFFLNRLHEAEGLIPLCEFT